MQNGIIAAGNWIIDHVKRIDAWPKQGTLVNIKDETIGTGGAPYNVLVDLAKMKVNFPLQAVGVIGNDQDGEYILTDLKKNHIDSKYMTVSNSALTSYTDVMTELGSGARTFFHFRGANAKLNYSHFETIQTNAKIFHLGYLLLLDELDKKDEEFGVVAARVLKLMQQKGCNTSVDVVSEFSQRFKQIVLPCLPYIDYLIVNEVEAGESTGLTIRNENNEINTFQLSQAADILLNKGVNEIVVIHFPEGGFAAMKNGDKIFVPSYKIAPGEIIGTVGAGDAFCAGVLYGLHENLAIKEALKLANANARFNLLDPTSTQGAVSLTDLKKFISSATLNESLSI